MSLILDALKRAERERAGERSAALQDLPAAPRQEAGRWGRRIALVLVALIAGVVVWSTFRPAKKPKPPVVAQEEGTTQQAREAEALEPAAPPPATPPPATATPSPPKNVTLRPAPSAPAPAPQQAPIQARPAAPQVIPGTESVASLDDVQSEEEIAEQAPPPAAAVPDIAPAPQPAPAAPAAPSTAPPAAEPAAPEPEAQAAPEPAKPEAARPDAIPDNIPKALTQPAPLRKLREMPPEYRADFPALNVEVHVFERAPTQRFVLVNGRRYRQGERLNEGPQLIEIVQEGLVLEYRGEKILYPLGR